MSESHSPDLKSNESDLSKELDIEEIVKDDIDDIDIDPEETEKLKKLISYIHGLPLEKKNQLLANLAKNRDVNPNGNVYYPTAKRDILKFKMQQIRARKRNQRLGKNVIKHKMEMAEAYRKSKENSTTSTEDSEKADNGEAEPNEEVDDGDSGDE